MASSLTVVTGPAGSGKTHRAREIAAEQDAISVWMQARPHRHAVEVAGQLVRRLLDRLGDLPPDLLAAVGTSCGPTIHADPLGRAEQLGALVAGALEDTLDRDLTVIIDDVDRLDDAKGPNRFIESLVRNRPSRMRLVICSRRELRFSVERLRSDGLVQQFGPDDLRLNDAVAARLLEQRIEAAVGQLGDDDRAAIIEHANGRPGALIALVGVALDVEPDQRRSTVQLLTKNGDPTVTAMAYAIDHLEPSIRRMLDDLVILDGVSPAALHRLGYPEPTAGLDHLVARGLIERPLDRNGRFQPARTTRDIVLSSPERLRDRAATTSRVAIEQGDARRGLAAARLGTDDDIAAALDSLGAAVLERGESQLVIDAVASLDITRQPIFDGLVGRAHQALGDWSRALTVFERVSAHGIEPSVAWRLGLVHYLQGDVEAARDVYRSALASDNATADVDLAMLLGYACAASWLVGDVDDARDLSRRSLTLATTLGADGALAVAHTGAAMVAATDGDRIGNEWHYGRALQHAERAGDTLQVARIRSNRGSRQMEEGNFTDALVELDRAVRAADLGSFGTFLALALSNRGEVLTKIGRLDDARTDLATSVNLLQSQGSRMVGYPLVGLARLHLIRGDVEQALGACERAQASSIGSSDRQFEIAVRTQLARALAERDLESGWNEVNAAAEHAAGSLDEPELWTVVADLALRRGDVDRAAGAARKATEMARARHDRYALAAAIEVTARTQSDDDAQRDFLDESFTIFEEIGCVLDAARVDLRRAEFDTHERGAARAEATAALARRLGARPLVRSAETFLRQHDTDPEPTLAVTLLGSFAVRRDGVEVAATSWQSKKARDLFKMLVVRSGRPVPRERAMDRLWPGEEPAKVSNRLSATLATIRAVLDPDKHFASEHFVRADGDAISVDIDAIDVDVTRFLEAARSALRSDRAADPVASSLLVAAESMYGGDVLEDDPYDDWYVPLREEARADYLAVAKALAAHRIGEGDTDDAIRLLLRTLEREPYDEPAHIDLITQLSRAGRHGDARRRHQYYVERMRELDLEPRPFPT